MSPLPFTLMPTFSLLSGHSKVSDKVVHCRLIFSLLWSMTCHFVYKKPLILIIWKISNWPSAPIHSSMCVNYSIVCGRADNNYASIFAHIIIFLVIFLGKAPNWSKCSILFSKYTDQISRNQIKNIFLAPNMDSNNLNLGLGHPLILPGLGRIDLQSTTSLLIN